MQKHSLIVLMILITLWAGVKAQSLSIPIEGDTAVCGMVLKHVELNSRVKTIPGFRIQIASFSGTNSKNNSFSLRDNFLLNHNDVGAYVVFDEPNFKVKVGDFRTRLEAYAYLQEIKDEYKGYIVRDNIYAEPPTLVDYAPDDETSGDE